MKDLIVAIVMMNNHIYPHCNALLFRIVTT